MTERDPYIIIIPHLAQRYNTCGDWQERGGHLAISVSDTGDARYNFLLAVHEFIEAKLCELAGITSEQVDAFDIHGEGAALNEPGDDPRAPYYRQHRMAYAVELMLAEYLGVSWNEYIDVLDRLDDEYTINRTPQRIK